MRNALLCTMVLAATAQTAIRADHGIHDSAKIFGEANVAAMSTELAQLAKMGKEVFVETFDRIPESKQGEFSKLDAKGKDQFFQRWTESQANAHRVKGLYVLVCKEPSKLRYVFKSKVISPSVAQNAGNAMLSELKKGDYNAGLEALVATVKQSMPTTTPAAGKAPVEADNNMMGTLLGIGAIVIGVWFLMALFRAMSGGTGGGFMSSLLGGLFGAAAGMMLYNALFSGHNTWSGGGDADSGGYDGSGGGDWGGGGGDFGGGDFGGGDF